MLSLERRQFKEGRSTEQDGSQLENRKSTDRHMDLGAEESARGLHLAWTGGRMKDGAL